MALTIGPAGRGADRRRDLALHGLGLLAGTLLMALLLTAVGIGLRAVDADAELWIGGALALLAVVWLLVVVSGRRVPWGRSRWQVPSHWRHTYPPGFTAAAYGFLLGLAAPTDALTPAFWALAGATVALADLPLAITAWLTLAGVRLWFTARWTLVVTAALACSAQPPDDLGNRSVLPIVRFAAASATLALAFGLAML